VDVFGHAAAVLVPLPSPHEDGIALVELPESPCTVPPDPDDGNTCTDFDGDGFFGASAHCASALVDCDDDNPLVYPGAFEIPGDGIANDCGGGGDAPVDESTGVFVSPTGNDSSEGGSRAAPFRTIAFALSRAAGSAAVFVAQGIYDEDEDVAVRASLIGGFVPGVTWTRAASDTSSLHSSVGFGVLHAVLVGVHTDNELDVDGFGGATVASFAGDNAIVASTPLLLVSSRVTSQTHLQAGASGSRVLRSSLALLFADAGDVVVDRSTVSPLAAGPGRSIVVTNSIVTTPFDEPLVNCDSCAAISIFHSNLLGAVSHLGINANGSPVIKLLDDNIFLAPSATLLDLAGSAQVVIAANNLDVPNGFYVAPDVDDVVALDSCAWPQCAFAAANNSVSAPLEADGFHLAADIVDHPSVNAGLDALPFGAPTTIAGDIDGACRFADGDPDIGPDER
jgi:hypothetical protein